MTAIVVPILANKSRRRRTANIRAALLKNSSVFYPHKLVQVEVVPIGHDKLLNTHTFGEHELKLVEHVPLGHSKHSNDHTFGSHTLQQTGGFVSIGHTKHTNAQSFGEHTLEGSLAPKTGRLLFIDGLESYSTFSDVQSRWSTALSGGSVYNPGGGVNGKGSVTTNANSGFNPWIRLNSGPQNNTEVPVGETVHLACLFRFATLPNNNARWFGIGTGSGDTGPSASMYLRIGTNNRISLTSLNTTFGAVTLATENDGAGLGYLYGKANRWIHLEVAIKFDGENGHARVWLDGKLIIDYEGALSSVPEAPVTYFGFANGGEPCEWDDIVIWESSGEEFAWDQIGALAIGGFKPHRIDTYRPTADGDLVQYAPTPPENANWENLADPSYHDDVTTENRSINLGDYDLIKVGDHLPTGPDEMLAVVITTVSTNTGLDVTYRERMKVGGRIFDAPTRPTPSVYSSGHRFWGKELNPDTYERWLPDDFNNAQFGYQIIDGHTGPSHRVSQLFVEVLRAGGLVDPEQPPLVPSAVVDLKIEAHTVTATLNDFPVLIDLALLPDEFKDTILPGAGNLRATLPGGSLLHLDVIGWDAEEQKGFAFVKLPSVYLDIDTEFKLRTYTSGNQPEPGNAGGRRGVWSDYEVVLFFDDEDGWSDHAGKKAMTSSALNVNTRAYKDVDSPLFAGKALRLHDPTTDATGFAINTPLSKDVTEVTFGMSLMTTRQHTSNNYSAGSLYNSANPSQYAVHGWRGSDSSGNDAIQMWDANNSWLNATPRFIPENDTERFRSWMQYSAASGGTRRHVVNGPDGYVASAAFTNRPVLNAMNLGRAQPGSSSEPGNFEYGFVYVRAEYLDDHWLRAEWNMLSDPGAFVTYPGDEEVIIGGLQNWNPDRSHPLLDQDLLINGHVKGTGNAWENARAFQNVEGKKYWEIAVLKGGAMALGVGDQYVRDNQRLGDFLPLQAQWVSAGIQPDGRFRWGFSDLLTIDTGLPFDTGDVLMFALDESTGGLWFGKNGVWFGDPVTGTGALTTLPIWAIVLGFMYTPVYYPMVSVFDAEVLGRFQAEVQTYPAPDGFEAFE